MKCPNCEEAFDHVWSEPFECRVPFGGGDVQINNLS